MRPIFRHYFSLGFFLIGTICLLGIANTKGKGKVAYRNYYLGTHYYAEGKVKKAESLFKLAYQAVPNQLNFGLAYALCLGETGAPNKGIQVLQSLERGLRPTHRNYREAQKLFPFVYAIVLARAGRYRSAHEKILLAIQRQEATEVEEPKRLAGMYNLAGFLRIMNQEDPRSHAGLSPHFHLQHKDLEQAFPFFTKAMALDSSREDAAKNVQFLADTLGKEVEITFRKRDTKWAPLRRMIRENYAHLPNRMERLLSFSQYDEVLFLVDISGSMVMEEVGCVRSDRFTIMREAAQFLLDHTPKSSLAGLATIGGHCDSEPKWWIPTDSLNRRRLRFEIRNLNPDGTTPLLTTLVETPALFTDNLHTTKSIFFISDGENICSLPGVDICDWATSLASKKIQINVLTFLDRDLSNSGAFAEYACLSERTGGQVRYLNPIACSIEEFRFDLIDRLSFELPPMERVSCWGSAVEELWAVYPEKGRQ